MKKLYAIVSIAMMLPGLALAISMDNGIEGSVTQANVKVLGNAPASSLSQVYESNQEQPLMFQNAQVNTILVPEFSIVSEFLPGPSVKLKLLYQNFMLKNVLLSPSNHQFQFNDVKMGDVILQQGKFLFKDGFVFFSGVIEKGEERHHIRKRITP